MEIGLFGLPKAEIERVTNGVSHYLSQIDGQKVVILGGTGFIGKWITAILATAIREGLDTELIVLARNQPESWIELPKSIGKANIRFLKHDLADDIPYEILETDQLIIAATPTSYVHGNLPNAKFDEATNSISQVLERYEVSSASSVKNVIHLSSGAIYRDSHTQFRNLRESDPTLSESDDAYVRAKIMLEYSLSKLHAKMNHVTCTNLRLFAFYGPGLPIDAHFAIGNFMRDVIRGAPIKIQGNPLTVRSYLHVTDLCTALIRLMTTPINGAFNLGSENAMDMTTIASTLTTIFRLPIPSIGVDSHSISSTYYVPNTGLMQSYIDQFDLKEFNEGLAEWKEWLEQNRIM